MSKFTFLDCRLRLTPLYFWTHELLFYIPKDVFWFVNCYIFNDLFLLELKTQFDLTDKMNFNDDFPRPLIQGFRDLFEEKSLTAVYTQYSL